MGKSLQDKMEDKIDGAGQSRVESTARSALGRLVTGFPPSRNDGGIFLGMTVYISVGMTV
jgi:hypothetical protein